MAQTVTAAGLVFLLLLGLFVAWEAWPDWRRARRARNRARRRGGYMAVSPRASAGASRRTVPPARISMGSWPRLGGQSEAAATLAERLGTSKTFGPGDSTAPSAPGPGARTTAADGWDDAA